MIVEWESNLCLPVGLTAETGPIKLPCFFDIAFQPDRLSFCEQPPAEADARNAIVALEEIFDGSPRLKGRLTNPCTAPG